MALGSALAGNSLASSLARMRRAYTPFAQATSPAAGTYDPNLDAEAGAVKRGAGYTIAGLDLAGSRSEEDYDQARHGLTTTRDQTLADFLSTHTRNTEDFEKTGTRLNEDHATNLAGIGRGYQRLGVQQTGAAVQQGVGTQGGTLAAALAARRGNQDIDNSAENRQYGRATDDLATSRQREGEDYGTQTSRTRAAYDDPKYGALVNAGTQYQRGIDDRVLQRGQVGIEAGQAANIDIPAQKNFQAQQAGYVGPQKPSNEFADAKGPYRLEIRGTRRYKIRPDGTPEYAGVRS